MGMMPMRKSSEKVLWALERFPRCSKDARFIEVVEELTDEYMHMGKASTGSSVGTGGMNTKMTAAKIATSVGADMVIANSKDR